MSSAVHFTPFFHNNGLVFQLIINEFLSASKEMQKALQLSENIKSYESKTPPLAQDLNELRISLSKLAGAKIENSYHLPWSLHRGFLTKLREYSDFLAQSMNEYSLGYRMYDHFHKAWLKCKQALDLLVIKRSEASVNSDLVCKNIENANKEIRRGARLIAQTIIHFKDNENVVYCLLRCQDRIADLFGKEFLKRLLCRMHPPSLSKVKSFLKSRYLKRGFDHLIPIITNEINSIK
jgi:hypothetical protein